MLIVCEKKLANGLVEDKNICSIFNWLWVKLFKNFFCKLFRNIAHAVNCGFFAVYFQNCGCDIQVHKQAGLFHQFYWIDKAFSPPVVVAVNCNYWDAT